MADFEKVTNALECHQTFKSISGCNCPKCPYDKDGLDNCLDNLRDDALALIKEQKAQIDKLNKNFQNVVIGHTKYVLGTKKETRHNITARFIGQDHQMWFRTGRIYKLWLIVRNGELYISRRYGNAWAIPYDTIKGLLKNWEILDGMIGEDGEQ